jgi:general secretion pathway protein L
MTSTLLIRLVSDAAAEWLTLGRDGRVLAGPQPGLPPRGAENVWVLVPSEHVLLQRAPRVARQRRQLEQAVPFAIEDQLAAPVEHLHVALASNDGDEIGVAVVAQARLDAWLARLRGAGLEPDRVLPESLLLPWSAGAATVLVDAERAVLRHGEFAAFAGELAELPSWLGLLAADGKAPSRLRWIGAAAPPAGYSVEREDPGTLLRWFAAQLARSHPIDLLQGRYRAWRGRDTSRRLWRWAAGLALAAGIAAFAQLALERQQLVDRNERQRAEMEQLLRAAVPGTTRVVDPKAQLAAEHARLGRSGGAGALPLLARIAPSFAGSGRYTLDGLEFRGDTLEVVIRAADIAALDALRESLAALALQVELTSANPGSGGVEGRLRIRSRT